MADRPDDRPKAAKPADSTPKIFVIVDGRQFPRPGLETFLAEAKPDAPQRKEDRREACSCQPVAGIYCECNKVRVCRCDTVARCGCVGHVSCSCVGRTACSCVGHTSRTGGCRCAPVH